MNKNNFNRITKNNKKKTREGMKDEREFKGRKKS